MQTESSELYEVKGVWYFLGEPLKIGGQVTIGGVVWNVLGVGRARSEAQSAFIWIRNEWYGTTVYAPSIRNCLTAA
jgi:hypothetical protein